MWLVICGTYLSLLYELKSQLMNKVLSFANEHCAFQLISCSASGPLLPCKTMWFNLSMGCKLVVLHDYSYKGAEFESKSTIAQGDKMVNQKRHLFSSYSLINDSK